MMNYYKVTFDFVEYLIEDIKKNTLKFNKMGIEWLYTLFSGNGNNILYDAVCKNWSFTQADELTKKQIYKYMIEHDDIPPWWNYLPKNGNVMMVYMTVAVISVFLAGRYTSKFDFYHKIIKLTTDLYNKKFRKIHPLIPQEIVSNPEKFTVENVQNTLLQQSLRR